MKPVVDQVGVVSLQARHGDLIGRYVQRRTSSTRMADGVVDAVFRAAADQWDAPPETALPWLLATARHECSKARRAGRLAGSGDAGRGSSHQAT